MNEYFLYCSDCKAACAVRCHLSSHPNNCERACGTCCEK